MPYLLVRGINSGDILGNKWLCGLGCTRDAARPSRLQAPMLATCELGDERANDERGGWDGVGRFREISHSLLLLSRGEEV